MATLLSQLKQYTTVVADTGDIDSIEQYQPEDATTNPSLVLKALQKPSGDELISQAAKWAVKKTNKAEEQVIEAGDWLAVHIGTQILKLVPGRVSTEVDARLSYNTEASVAKARKIIGMYEENGVGRERVLIKLASTWQGIKAAEILEKEGINCNLTLLFSFAQARACAEAGAFLISPFVGRILDWYKAKTGEEYTAQTDPGVLSVTQIYNYYKKHGYKTVVMGASFRNIGEILALAGCDRLTISPNLLEQLNNSEDKLERHLIDSFEVESAPEKMSESEFYWEHNQDPMAVDKLAEGIRNFAADQLRMEEMIRAKLN
ncbi:transaldolase [Celerinatantimonas sp. MCCC 1A17872]|uniref:transaldolase n=1 Tax=Celerinatantimonas sp. MCCC 1A17872 TaxID=3177514 RepID=UPI0038C1C76B